MPEFYQVFYRLIFGAALIYIGFFLLFFSIAFYFLIKFLRRAGAYKQIFTKKIFLVTLPKEALSDESSNKREIKEWLSPSELFLDNIGGLRVKPSFKRFFFGREDNFSFEIVRAKDGLISFYIISPELYASYLEQQIHAQFPTAQVELVPDYNIFSSNKNIIGAWLSLRNTHILPIKTYLNLQTDPLNAVLSSLTQIDEGDAATIQIMARSAHKKWHILPMRVAREMQQGKSFQASLSKSKINIFRFFWEFFSTGFSATKSKEEKSREEMGKTRQLSPMEQEIVKNVENKNSKAGLDVNIRIVVSASSKERGDMYLKNIANSFSQYTLYQYGNGFNINTSSSDTFLKNFIYRNFDDRKDFILNTEELTSIFHFPLPITETPNIRWLISRSASAPVDVPKDGIILGQNIYRGKETLIKIKKDDRRRHVYIIGKTGTGKSVLLSNMAVQDIKNGEGVCVVDPHGSLVEDILASIPKERAEDVVLFDASDIERPIGLNMLEAKEEAQRDYAVQEMIAVFYKLFPPEVIGPMFEHNMRNAMLTLMSDLENPGTITEIPRMFSDAEYAKAWVKKVKDPVVKAFWEKEMAKTSDFHKSEMLGYLISKVGRFVENEMMRNIIGQQKSGINFREAMDKQKILLINLSKGKIGEVNANLLGLIIISKIQMAAMARADMPEEERKDFYLYIDEFQNFITDSISVILSEARKYRLCLNLAHQYLGQLSSSSSVSGKGGGDTKIKDAVLGTVGTIAVFKIGIEDAEVLAKEFKPVFNEFDLINVEKFNAFVKLLVDNQPTRPFNMRTIAPLKGNKEVAEAIRKLSRLKYGRPKEIVEKEIMERSRLGSTTPTPEMNSAERNL